MSGTAARVRYVPLGAAERRQDGAYAAQRALFLQSYRFSVDDGREAVHGVEGLRGRLARRLREALARARGAARRCVGAGLARAWRGWRPRADPLLGCFGAAHHKYYLHGYV